MNKKFNIAEILKDAPKGTKLYSPICGECKYIGFGGCKTIVVQSPKENVIYFTKEGKYYTFEESSECLLFPSKDNRDWSTFKVPKKYKEFNPFEKVLVKELVGNCRKYVWIAAEYSHFDEDTKQHYCVGAYGFADNEIMPYEGNEDKLGKYVEK